MSKFEKTYRKIVSEAFGDGNSVGAFEPGEIPVNVVSAAEAERRGVNEADAAWLHDNRFSLNDRMLSGFVKFEKTLDYDYKFQDKAYAILTYDLRLKRWSCVIKRGDKVLDKTIGKESAEAAFTSVRDRVGALR